MLRGEHDPTGIQLFHTWTTTPISYILNLPSLVQMPSDSDMTGLILLEENDLRFPRFTNEVRMHS